MSKRGKGLVWFWALRLLTYGLWASTSSFAQSLWPFGTSQEQEKEQTQRQVPVERAFSENYWKLTEKQRALAGEKYEEYLKNTAHTKVAEETPVDIKKLEAPTNPFQAPNSKASQGSRQ